MSASYIQNSFSGGINLFDDSSKLKDEEYYLLINGRNRNNHIEGIKLPLRIEELPFGNIQGIYTAAPYLIVFINGKAYVKDYFLNTPFVTITGLQMETTVDTIYLVLLPASTINFKRIKTEESINGNSVNTKINLTTIINGSSRCALVQDGINQPWVIFADGTARVTQNYSQWSLEQPEYVPIGTLMLYHNAILYIVGKDLSKVSNILFRSLSGRPLDFMVNIRRDGEKPDLSESLGGALTVSHRVSYDEITCLNNINSPDGAFYIGTLNNSYYVSPNYDRLIFGEPTFDNLPLFNTGPLNNFSIINVLGDTAFIDTEGIKSFNSVMQTQNESKLNPFSLKIDNLFKSIIQNIVAATSFDLYAIFAVSTIYGFGLIFYDTTRQCFTSLDIYPAIEQIKQFCFLRYRGIRKLFFTTVNNGLYEAFIGPTTATIKLITKEYNTPEPSNEQVSSNVKLVFNNILENGIVGLTSYADRWHKDKQEQKLDINIVLEIGNKTIPYGINVKNQKILKFSLDNKVRGSKLSHMIEFNCLAELTHIETIPEVDVNL